MNPLTIAREKIRICIDNFEYNKPYYEKFGYSFGELMERFEIFNEVWGDIVK